jgi:hypothetical protein
MAGSQIALERGQPERLLDEVTTQRRAEADLGSPA